MTEPCTHDHHHSLAADTLDQSLTRGFYVAIALTAVTLVAEVVGGFWTNSLALLSDAAHVFMDLSPWSCRWRRSAWRVSRPPTAAPTAGIAPKSWPRWSMPRPCC